MVSHIIAGSPSILASPAAAGVASFTAADNGRTIMLDAGRELDVVLDEGGAGGLRWALQNGDPGSPFEIVSRNYLPNASGGGSVALRLKVKDTASGLGVLYLREAKEQGQLSWTYGNAFVLNVGIVPAAQPAGLPTVGSVDGLDKPRTDWTATLARK